LLRCTKFIRTLCHVSASWPMEKAEAQKAT
jgi:hypothetical protein